MTDDVQRAHWGNLEGQNWAGLARLSTEEVEGDDLLALTKAADHVTAGLSARWSGRGETSVAAVDR
ncbi:hypothetical protein, partial [Streptomyces sp. NPDC003483]